MLKKVNWHSTQLMCNTRFPYIQLLCMITCLTISVHSRHQSAHQVIFHVFCVVVHLSKFIDCSSVYYSHVCFARVLFPPCLHSESLNSSESELDVE